MDPLKQPAPPAIEYVVAAPAIEYVVAAEQLVDRLAQILAEQSAAVAVACEILQATDASLALSDFGGYVPGEGFCRITLGLRLREEWAGGG